MKLNRKLVMISVAALMGVSPVVANTAANTAEAAAVYTINGAKVKVTKTMHAVSFKGKKTKFRVYKNVTYKVWRATKINGKTYYALDSTEKNWIPASATKGKVSYGKKTTTKKSTAKKTTAKKTSSTKSTAKKTTSKKTSSKKTTKKTASTKLVTIRRTNVVGKNGKKVKTYMGSKKWTVLGKKVSVIGHGTKTINGVKYYALDPSHFVKASDVKVVK